MQMISFVFFGLVAITFVCLLLVNRVCSNDSRAVVISNTVLLVSSYAFVGYADWRFAVILALMTLTTRYFAKRRNTCKWCIFFAIVALGFFKYTNFFASSFAKLFGKDFTLTHIILPIGISFYTFSAIGYLTDVYRNKIPANNLLSVALYLAFFPKITSGPIQRSGDFFTQTEKRRIVGWNDVATNIQIFCFGLFKKIVLADRLSVFVDQVFDTPLAFGSVTVFMATIAYSFQIYFDFSGYSDMAIGVAGMLGIKLPRNFNLPYLAQNVTELWKRWHITLSSWLQEYVYISFGGNRKGKVRTYLNLLLTMVIGGIWHGANWTYVLWGTVHGLALIVHKMWMSVFESNKRKHTLLSRIISICMTFLFTSFCWIFFRAESVSLALQIVKKILSFESGLEQPYLWLFVALIIWGISIVVALISTKKDRHSISGDKTNVSTVEGFYPTVDLSTFWGMVVFFVFCGLILCLAYTGGSPFIYGKY